MYTKSRSILFKIMSTALLSLSLIGCDGFDFDSDSVNGTANPEQTFTRSELAFNVLFSSLLLNESGFNNNRDGFIVLFKSSAELDQIELRNSDDNDALVGSYPWTIVNDDLQVTYPNGVTCTSNKTAQTGLQITASTNCDGGEPNNDRIRNDLNKPIAFDEDDLSSNTVNIDNSENDIDDQRIEFFSNGTFEQLDLNVDGDEIAETLEVGVYADSAIYKNVVRLENTNPNSDEYSLLILLSGSLDSGTMLQLRYVKSTDLLKEIRIFSIGENNLWDVDSLYDVIDIDS